MLGFFRGLLIIPRHPALPTIWARTWRKLDVFRREHCNQMSKDRWLAFQIDAALSSKDLKVWLKITHTWKAWKHLVGRQKSAIQWMQKNNMWCSPWNRKLSLDRYWKPNKSNLSSSSKNSKIWMWPHNTRNLGALQGPHLHIVSTYWLQTLSF